jgi:hypothetical protein
VLDDITDDASSTWNVSLRHWRATERRRDELRRNTAIEVRTPAILRPLPECTRTPTKPTATRCWFGKFARVRFALCCKLLNTQGEFRALVSGTISATGSFVPA